MATYRVLLACPHDHELLAVDYECSLELTDGASEKEHASTLNAVARQVITKEIRARLRQSGTEDSVWCEKCGYQVRPRMAIVPAA